MKKTLYIIFFSILCSACELTKEIDYDTIYEGDKIVVHGFISPSEGINIIIKKSLSPNNVKGDDRVDEVIIDLYEDGIKVQPLVAVNDYLYSTPTKFSPRLGSIYHFKVVSKSLPDIISNPQSVFLPAEIDTLYLKIDELTSYANLIVSFNNKQGFERSFYLKVFYFIDGEIDSSKIESDFFFYPSNLIDKTTKGINVIEKQLGRISVFDSLKVEFYTLSPDLTEFLQSLQKYYLTAEDPFYEQTYPVFTNIEGGYGIFASYSFVSQVILK